MSDETTGQDAPPLKRRAGGTPFGPGGKTASGKGRPFPKGSRPPGLAVVPEHTRKLMARLSAKATGKAVGAEVAKAFADRAFDRLLALLDSRSDHVSLEACRTVLGYAWGLPRMSLNVTGGSADLAGEIAAALKSLRERRAVEHGRDNHQLSEVSDAIPATVVASDVKDLHKPPQEAAGGAISATVVEAVPGDDFQSARLDATRARDLRRPDDEVPR